jgi:hypothetical protein
MRHARRAITILIGFATGLIATATVAYAAVVADGPVVAPAELNKVPGYYNYFPGGEAAIPPTTAPGLALWQFLALVTLMILIAVAIVGLGYSLSQSRRPQRSRRSQQPLPH